MAHIYLFFKTGSGSAVTRSKPANCVADTWLSGFARFLKSAHLLKFLIIMAFCFAPFAAMAQVIFQQDFNGSNPLNGWSQYKSSTTGTGWEITDVSTSGSMSNYGGTFAAYQTANSTLTQEQNSWLVTPSIQIPAEGNYALIFWSLLANNPGFNSEVCVSLAGGDPFNSGIYTKLKELTSDDTTRTWKPITVAIPKEYAGQTIYLGFRYRGEGRGASTRWVIDDVKVKEYTVPFTDNKWAETFDNLNYPELNTTAFPTNPTRFFLPEGWTRYKVKGA